MLSALAPVCACVQSWDTRDSGGPDGIDEPIDLDVISDDMAAADDSGDPGDVPVADDGGVCPGGLTNCSGVCADLSSDPSHCGSCGHGCVLDEVCNEGECTSRCAEGLEECAGSCVDLMMDEAHCGACDHPCDESEACDSGSCVCVPDCFGRTCGPDGCGDTCPPGCRTGYDCTDAGICTCEGTVCGSICCPSDQACYEESCCTPDCSGRICGSDSCGDECPPGCSTGYACAGDGTCGFDELVFEAEGPGMGHNCGRAEADGWSASTGPDEEAHMLFGPYTTDVPGGSRTAVFRMMVDNNSADNLRVVRLDVQDFTTESVLSERAVHRMEFSAAFVYQDFSLSFIATSDHSLEFRVWWDDTSYVRIDRVTVR
ncbi:MAG: hypothetical protein ABIJ56_07180 [Pseudomonadota bacterium]